jgi:hypothetical protein
MIEDKLLLNLQSTHSSSLTSEARGDADTAIAKTAGHPKDQDCSISECDNCKGTQQHFEFIFSSDLSSDVNTPPHKTVGSILVLKTRAQSAFLI